MSTIHYKGFAIEVCETSPSRYRARIRRDDGRKIKTFPDGREYESIKTGGMEGVSAEDAVQVAKERIDGGGME